MQLGHVFLCAYKFTSVYSLFCREELHFFGTRLQNNKTSSGSAMTMVSYWTIHDVTRKHKMADHHHFKVNKMIQKINNTIFIHFATLNSWRYSCVWWLQLRGFPVRDKEVLSRDLNCGSIICWFSYCIVQVFNFLWTFMLSPVHFYIITRNVQLYQPTDISPDISIIV